MFRRWLKRWSKDPFVAPDIDLSGMSSDDGAIDLTTLYELADDNPESLAALVQAYLDSVPERLATLQDALATDDVPTARREIRAIAASSETLGVASIRDIARRIECSLDSRDTDRVSAAASQLSECWIRVRDDLQRMLNAALSETAT